MRTIQLDAAAKNTLERLVKKSNQSEAMPPHFSQVSFKCGNAVLEVRGADWMIGLLTIAIISIPLWI